MPTTFSIDDELEEADWPKRTPDSLADLEADEDTDPKLPAG